MITTLQSVWSTFLHGTNSSEVTKKTDKTRLLNIGVSRIVGGGFVPSENRLDYGQRDRNRYFAVKEIHGYLSRVVSGERRERW